MPAGLTPLHVVLILVIALVVIGPGKLPSVGKALGESIREFRKSMTDVKEAVSLEPLAAPPLGAITASPVATVAAPPVVPAAPAATPPPPNQAADNDPMV